jgi:hypothetical protein
MAASSEGRLNIIAGIAVLIGFAYLLIGTALWVTNGLLSPCRWYESDLTDPDWAEGSIIQTTVVPILTWAPRFVEHAIREDMPIRHFVFRSDCQWTERPPRRQRLFARPAGEASCPTGTSPFRGDRCSIPIRATVCVGDNGQPLSSCAPFPTSAGVLRQPRRSLGEPVMAFAPTVTNARCPSGWITESLTPRICRLPALEKPEGKPCPKGFVAWKAEGADAARTDPNVEVCRLAPPA